VTTRAGGIRRVALQGKKGPEAPMTRKYLSRTVVAAAACVGVAGFAAAQDQGVKQVEALVKASGNTVQAISQTKLQLMKTMDVYNSLVAGEGKDVKKLYKDLQKEMENTEKRRAEITTRAGAMTTEADTLFKSWETTAAGIDSESLRKRSEERLKQTKASYAEIGTVGHKAAQLYDPVMKTLADQVKYLGNDLNPSALASLKPDADKLNKKVEELNRAIDDTITATNTKINAIRPQ
jgi:gas vesicle protein